MAEQAVIEATRREGTGKGPARTARREGRVPGVLYGHGEDSVSLSVDARELGRLVHSISIENTILDLTIEGGDPVKVLIRELQQHPFRDELTHIDFFHVSMTEKLQVDVPIVLEGSATGVKDDGGVIDHQLRELQVVCLPTDIPERIVVDVSDLAIGDSIHVSDLTVPNVEIQIELDRTVVSVLAPKVIEEVVEEEEEGLEEPEIIGRDEDAGEGEGEGGEAEAAGDEA